MRDLIGCTLGHCRVVEKIGEGGMGEVYRAHDERLDRDVAIKVLHEAVAQDADRLARFEREAKAVAKLAHPNILEIWDFGSEDSVAYAVMELLEGETLRDLISKGSITTGKAVEYARTIADGLAAAHEKGIIHRDLKPENVFLTKDGRIKILDFGLAKLKLPEQDLTTETPTATLDTAPGGLIGTIPYMAPEQVQGQPTDHRSDIFALGCVLFEMLTGQRPFRGSTTVETAAAILKDDPEPISVAAPTTSPVLGSVVSKCLEKRPEDRFSSAHDLSLTLGAMVSATSAPPGQDHSLIAKRWPHILAVVIAAVIAILVILPPEALFERRGDEASDVSLPRIVVLPFENLGPPEDEYFTDGMTDEVRGMLGRLAGLEVIARYSSDRYRDTSKTMKQVAEELGARYLLTAKVRWQKFEEGPSRIRLSSELVDVQPGSIPVAMWQESFDATLADVFQVQTEVATRVVRALDVTLGGRERRVLGDRPTNNLAAYKLFMEAESIRQAGAGMPLRHFRRLEDLYQKAIGLDPDFALAWARLSAAQSTMFFYGETSPWKADAARRSAERALGLDASLPEGRRALAYFFRRVRADLGKAREQVDLGLKDSPNHNGLLFERALIAWFDPERVVEPLADLQRVAALDPLSASAARALGLRLLFLRRYAEAEASLNRALILDPADFTSIKFKMFWFLARGDLEGAREFVRAASKRVSNGDEFITYLAVSDDLYWVLGADLQERLLSLDSEAFGGNEADQSLALAHTYHLRGQREQTLAWAERARAAFAGEIIEVPDQAQNNALMGVALAYLGRREEALAHGREGARLHAIRPDSIIPYSELQLVRICILLGQDEAALDLLEPLSRTPMYLSPGWLSIDPLFDPLRDHPRFQALLEEYDTN